MNELTISDVIAETKTLLGAVRQSLVKVAQNLYFLREKGDYNGPFGAYCEDLFGISQSMTSKLTNLYDAWVIKAGIPMERIEGQDYEKLYGYIPLLENKDPELALAEVANWSRSDIRAQKEESAPCEHSFKKFCEHCWTPCVE